jgi:hypothetical protein
MHGGKGPGRGNVKSVGGDGRTYSGIRGGAPPAKTIAVALLPVRRFGRDGLACPWALWLLWIESSGPPTLRSYGLLTVGGVQYPGTLSCRGVIAAVSVVLLL